MIEPANYKQVLRHFHSKPQAVKKYFPAFEDLVKDYSWDVCVPYIYSRVEAAKHMTIYCGIVKLHWTDANLTRSLVDKDYMSRSRFIELFKIVFNRQILPNLQATLERGEAVRDRIVHGKHWTQAEARKCLVVLAFSTFGTDGAR
jgi:hypothetical protein